MKKSTRGSQMWTSVWSLLYKNSPYPASHMFAKWLNLNMHILVSLTVIEGWINIRPELSLVIAEFILHRQKLLGSPYFVSVSRQRLVSMLIMQKKCCIKFLLRWNTSWLFTLVAVKCNMFDSYWQTHCISKQTNKTVVIFNCVSLKHWNKTPQWTQEDNQPLALSVWTLIACAA